MMCNPEVLDVPCSFKVEAMKKLDAINNSTSAVDPMRFSILILIKLLLHCPQIFSVLCTADFSADDSVHTTITAVQTT